MYSVLLYTHLGLGDQIMCHGIVREYCKKYDAVAILASPHTYISVTFMYRDLRNLTVLRCDHLAATKYVADHSNEYTEIKKLGYDLLDKESGVPLEKQLYALAGVPFEKKWESFYVQRDQAREQTLHKKMAPLNAYAFLHEDSERGYEIKRRKISPQLTLVEPDPALTENIFDYGTLIEKAAEIHVIDSSFMFLTDCLQYDNPRQKLFVHRYARPNPEWVLPLLKKQWTILGVSTPSGTQKLLSSLKNKARSFLAK